MPDLTEAQLSKYISDSCEKKHPDKNSAAFKVCEFMCRRKLRKIINSIEPDLKQLNVDQATAAAILHQMKSSIAWSIEGAYSVLGAEIVDKVVVAAAKELIEQLEGESKK